MGGELPPPLPVTASSDAKQSHYDEVFAVLEQLLSGKGSSAGQSTVDQSLASPAQGPITTMDLPVPNLTPRLS